MNAEFNGRPFVAGSLVGIRAFKVNARGVLTGVIHEQAWTPTLNDAVCNLGVLGRMQRQMFETVYGATAREHQLAGMGCTCGFYAYFKGANSYIGQGQVAGLVEGFGVCTVGSRGFRAEKAHLIALVAPNRRRFPGLRACWAAYARGVRSVVRRPIHGLLHATTRLVVKRMGFPRGAKVATWVGNRCPKITDVLQALVGLATAAIAIAFLDGIPHWAAFLLGMSIMQAVSKPEDKRLFPGLSDAEFELVRSNYPHVPVYPSRRAAVRAHPLTPPDKAGA